VRLLRRRIGPLAGDLESRTRALPTAELEDLAESLLGFGSPVDLTSWLVGRGA
jgi:hypothetical protein